jgi:Ca-activated chloride channel family protein
VIPETLHFLRPAWLWALSMLVVFAWSWRRRSRGAGAWEQLCDSHLLTQLATRSSGGAERFPLALLALGWTAACFALSGPTWERLPQASFREPARSVFVLTLGDSMNGRDVRPSRLARARHKLLDALDRTAGGSVALVVVREEAFAVTPLTDDADVLREAIPLLETRLMPGRAVLPVRGFDEARRLLEPVGLGGARIVLVTDGSDDDPKASEAAVRALAGDGVQVSVLALAGANESLAALARSGGGAQAALTTDDGDLDRVFAKSGAENPVSGSALVHSDVKTQGWKDMGAWLLWIPLLLAPLAFRKGWAGALFAAILFQLAPVSAEAGVLDTFERPDQRGARAFTAGRYAESAQAFEDPAWQAVARYRAGDFAGASQALTERSDAVSQYNLGNALARAGQLEAAVAAYERALAAAPSDADAGFNRDLLKQLLEQQAKPPPESGQESKGAQDQPQNGAGEKQDQAQSEKNHEQDQGEGTPAGEPSQGSDDSQSEKGEMAGDAAAEAARTANAAKADGEIKAQDASGSPADPAPDSAPGTAIADAGEPDATSREFGASAPPSARPLSAQEQEHAQWMARLPDDPGGLLREKIRRDYQRKQAARQGEVGQ